MLKNNQMEAQINFPLDKILDSIVEVINKKFDEFGESLRLQIPIELITEKMLCEKLGITHPTVIRLRKNKTIPFLQVGGSIRYDYNAVVLSLQNQPGKDYPSKDKKKYNQNRRDSLANSYIKQTIAKQSGFTLSHSDIPDEVVALKSTSLKIKRKLKNVKQ